MQLTLFEDNRPGILLNIADEFILSRDLVQAVSVYEQVCADFPDDRSAAPLLALVGEWHSLLSGINDDPGNPAYLQSIWLRHDSIAHPALRLTVLGILIDELRALPEPEKVYISPHFHLGHLLMAAGSHAEAADSFRAALMGNAVERGRFMAWRGDALTMAGNDDAALKCYLAAFLDDPYSVDMQNIKNRTIHNLHTSLHFELDDEIEGDDEPAWLPAWGWLHGVFALPLQPVPAQTSLPCAAEFETRIAQDNCPIPRIWFDMLTHAERLRVVQRDDRELAAVRRLMKKTSGFMFGWYMDKVKGRNSAIR
ncbi:MAG: hypothetical protein WC007_14400 [Pelobacteraceae bacterium]